MDVENVTETSDYKPWQFKKGNPGGPGRPAGITLKQYAREFLAKMTDDERQDFMDGLAKDTIWKMAEGNPATETDITTKGEALTPLLVQFIDDKSNSGDSS